MVVTSNKGEGFESYEKLTGNFAWGLIDMKDEQFSEVPANIGSFKALIRSKDVQGNIVTKELSSHACS